MHGKRGKGSQDSPQWDRNGVGSSQPHRNSGCCPFSPTTALGSSKAEGSSGFTHSANSPSTCQGRCYARSQGWTKHAQLLPSKWEAAFTRSCRNVLRVASYGECNKSLVQVLWGRSREVTDVDGLEEGGCRDPEKVRENAQGEGISGWGSYTTTHYVTLSKLPASLKLTFLRVNGKKSCTCFARCVNSFTHGRSWYVNTWELPS